MKSLITSLTIYEFETTNILTKFDYQQFSKKCIQKLNSFGQAIFELYLKNYRRQKIQIKTNERQMHNNVSTAFCQIFRK